MATTQDDMPDLEEDDEIPEWHKEHPEIVSFGECDSQMICEEISIKTVDNFYFPRMRVNIETGDPDGSKSNELVQKMAAYLCHLEKEHPDARIVTGPDGRNATVDNKRIWLDISDHDVVIKHDRTEVDLGESCTVVIGADRGGSLESLHVRIRHKHVGVNAIYVYLYVYDSMYYRS